jgi:VanZ family protein
MRAANLFRLGFGVILAGILAACLWPFHAPKNQVAWLAHANGLRFGRFGTILSQGMIHAPCSPAKSGCTLELWLRPEFVWNMGTILAFYAPRHLRGFSLRQSNGWFVVETGPWNKENLPKFQILRAGRTWGRPGFTFVTLTLGPEGTKAYIDGALVRAADQFRISADNLSGRLVVANSPVSNDSWSGVLKGFALYDRAFPAAEVLRDYEVWVRTGRPETARNYRPVLLYLFDERSGDVVHNRAGSGGDLLVPRRYAELHHTFLQRPWDEYSPSWGYWEDVLVNIAGFVPLGFFCYGYLLSTSFWKRPALGTVVLGFLLSLSVEVLQAYLPTRDSGMTDVITNTLGSGMGILLFRCTSVVCEGLVRSRRARIRYLARLFVDHSRIERNEPLRTGISV